MKLSLSPRFERVLKKRMKRGGYASPEDALLAGLASLEQQETFGDFGPGELDKLLAEGEADIARGDVEDAERVFAEIRRLGDSRSSKR
jgi:hypothetical protein